MHKLRKAAVLVVALGSVGLLSAGTALADGHDGHGGKGGRGKNGTTINVQQSTNCRSHDANVSVLGQVGVLNGVGGNLLNGEGNTGTQETGLGSSMGCDNTAFDK
ncbi:hypothetical protein [Streptomyces sp. GESEQ-35]|uniref:hypothetical protein n=1 Tax=Streptomyces sp. GESEQ-35 TaxID=2812657 RepID=UPI001B31AD92|nr:hypothetical protein [Streptomyces sp. GESEQ-35]